VAEFPDKFKKLGLSGYNAPKATPGHPTKKFVVAGKSGDDVKLVRFGAKGYSNNYSPEARAAYRSRHAGEGAQPKTTAGYWAYNYLWSAGGNVSRAGKGTKRGERFK
jgi:hypothetical protein